MVTRAPPNGTNMTMLTAGWASGAAVGKFAFDRQNTFGFVTMICAYPFVYAVPRDSPITSFKDLLDRANAAPGKLTYVITSLGSVYHREGGDIPTPTTPEAMGQQIEDEIANWKRLIEVNKIKID